MTEDELPKDQVPTETAYIAGIIDGEGYVGIARRNQKNDRTPSLHSSDLVHGATGPSHARGGGVRRGLRRRGGVEW